MPTSKTIFVINPGSTSTKIALFVNQELVFTHSVEHSLEELQQFDCVAAQLPMRQQAITKALAENNIDTANFSCIMGRGGMLRPIDGGVYAINPLMRNELQTGAHGEHASNLGALLAFALAEPLAIPSYIADPPVVDELQPLATVTGVPEINRRSLFHALNQKAVGRRAAKSLGKDYNNTRLIVAHVGGGISVGAHEGGRVIDTNNALDGDGPFTPERAGAVPAGQLAALCFSGKYSHPEIKRMLTGQGGLVAHLGTNSGKEIGKRMEQGDTHAETCYKAMAYQIAKSIGAKATVLCGNVDAVILTGGLMHDPTLRQWIIDRVQFIAPVIVYPGEDEMLALAEAGYRALNGEGVLEY